MNDVNFFLSTEMSLLAGMKRKRQNEHDSSNGHVDQFITLQQLQERHLLNTRPNDLRSSGSLERERKDSEMSAASSADERPKMRSLTREFAQEFHESVLATTRQQVEMKGQSKPWIILMEFANVSSIC